MCFSVASSAKEYTSVSVRLKSGKRQQFFLMSTEYLLYGFSVLAKFSKMVIYNFIFKGCKLR